MYEKYLFIFKLQGLYLWERSESKEKAAEHFVKSAKFNPQNAAAFRYLGDYYRGVCSDNQRALKCYQRAISLNPDDSDSGVSEYHIILLNYFSFNKKTNFVCINERTKNTEYNRMVYVICWSKEERRAWK